MEHKWSKISTKSTKLAHQVQSLSSIKFRTWTKFSPKSSKPRLAQKRHCTMRTLYSIFSSQPNKMGHDITLPYCDIIQHIFIPTRSVARKTLLWTFSWASNSKFEIFLELYPCSNYRILAFFTPISVWIHGNSIIPPYHTQGDFGYRGILLYKQHIVQWTMSIHPPTYKQLYCISRQTLPKW